MANKVLKPLFSYHILLPDGRYYKTSSTGEFVSHMNFYRNCFRVCSFGDCSFLRYVDLDSGLILGFRSISGYSKIKKN